LNTRVPTLFVGLALVGFVLGLGGGGALAAPVGSARPVERPRTVFAGSRRIYAFALGAHRITWISRTHMRGRYPGCEMYIRPLRGGRTTRAPLPSAGCGVKPPVDFAPQKPVLVSGVAAWVKSSSCGNTECFWKIATITGGETKARVVDNVDVDCNGLPACLFPHRAGKSRSTVAPPHPHPSLAGHGNLLVYSTGNSNIDQVRRIVGRRTASFAVPPGNGDVESLTVGGGAVEVRSTVLNVGDGCGCVGSPAWSPDGSKIAYLHGQFYNQQFDPEPPEAAPAVMNADGSARHDLTPTNRANEGPVWSPDGTLLAYGETLSTLPYSEEIAVASADGSGAHDIGLGDDPAWSPDGSKIAFASAGCGGAAAAISLMNPDGTDVQLLASFTPGPTCLGNGGIAWSPDGNRIAFSLNGILEVMDANGTNVHPLGTNTAGDEPAWSPDSSQIVFHRNTGLWVIGVDGTGLRQLTQGPDDHPSWSPNGQTIAFGSDRDDPFFMSSALQEIYLVDPDGSNLRPFSFTTPTVFEDQRIDYAANGKRLPSLPAVPTLAGNVAAVGSTNENGGHEITLFDASTAAQLALLKVGGSADEFEIAGADSHWIVFRLGVTIFALNAHSHHVVRLTRAPADPVGLSVVGRRIAWAENINGEGRIRVLELPS
jgi:Tol biopolymer transport system component